MTAQTTSPDLSNVKALFFDVFGTTVDWRSTVTRELSTAASKSLRPNTKAKEMSARDWGDFAAAWRATYHAFTKAVASSDDPSKPYKTIDEHHYDSLRELLVEWGIEGLWDENEVKQMSLVWHCLDPWPDTVQGIIALNKCVSTCTLSNGNVGLLQDMAAYASLEWTHILSSEMFKSYKPNPKVYLGAAEKLGLRPQQCCMVAAHLSDLEAARKCGFSTIYVERAQEEAWDDDKVKQTRQEEWVDIWVTDGEQGFVTVAERLGKAST